MQQVQGKKGNGFDEHGFTMLPNNFIKNWAKTLGKGPLLLYLQLCTYCHQDKYIAWPPLRPLGEDLGMTKNSLISYQKILQQNGLIQKIKRRKANGNYHANLYRLTPMPSAKNGPHGVQKLDQPGPKNALYQVQYLHPNNNNKNKNNRTTTTSAVVAFQTEEEKRQDLRERMLSFDFRESFIDKMLKTYSLKKIFEKIELYADGREVKNKEGWLMTALKEGYGKENENVASPAPSGRDLQLRVKYITYSTGLPRRFTPRNDRNKSQKKKEKILPREEALAWIRKIRREIK